MGPGKLKLNLSECEDVSVEIIIIKKELLSLSRGFYTLGCSGGDQAVQGSLIVDDTRRRTTDI